MRLARGHASPLSQKLNGLIQSEIGDSFYPYSVQSFRTQKIRRSLAELLQSKNFECVVLDGLHVAACLMTADGEWIPELKCAVVYRAHNIEGDIWNLAAKKTMPLMRWIALHQAHKMVNFEKHVVGQVSATCPVSPSDEARLRELVPGAILHSTLIGMSFGRPPVRSPEKQPLSLLFVGKLDWTPNSQGLEWFLDDVWPRLPENKFELHVLGRNAPESLVNKLKANHIVFHGPQLSLEPFYRDAVLTLAPLFVGSGTRVKIIESVQRGRPVLSTHLGALGLDLGVDQAYLADTAEEWIQILSNYVPADGFLRAQRAFESFQQRFDSRLVADSFFGFLNSKVLGSKIKHQ